MTEWFIEPFKNHISFYLCWVHDGSETVIKVIRIHTGTLGL